MGHIPPLASSHFRMLIGSYPATNWQIARYKFMATQAQTAREAMTVHPHDVALPYRGDGVARALHDAFDGKDSSVPRDMAVLLAVLDQSPVADEHFDLIHDRIER